MIKGSYVSSEMGVLMRKECGKVWEGTNYKNFYVG